MENNRSLILEENPLEEVIITTPSNLYIPKSITKIDEEEVVEKINGIKNIINEVNNIYGMRCKYEINKTPIGLVLFFKNNKTNKNLIKEISKLDGFYLYGYKKFSYYDSYNLKTLKIDYNTRGVLFYEM
jgi:hypothetical protein